MKLGMFVVILWSSPVACNIFPRNLSVVPIKFDTFAGEEFMPWDFSGSH